MDAGVMLIEVSRMVDTVYHAAVGAHLIDCLQEKHPFHVNITSNSFHLLEKCG